ILRRLYRFGWSPAGPARGLGDVVLAGRVRCGGPAWPHCIGWHRHFAYVRFPRRSRLGFVVDEAGTESWCINFFGAIGVDIEGELAQLGPTGYRQLRGTRHPVVTRCQLPLCPNPAVMVQKRPKKNNYEV